MARRQLRQMFLFMLVMFSHTCLFVSEPTVPQRLWQLVAALPPLNTQAAMAVPATVVGQQTAQDLALPEKVINTIYGFLGVIATALLGNILSFVTSRVKENSATQATALKTEVTILKSEVQDLRKSVEGIKEKMVTKADVMTKTDTAFVVVLFGLGMLLNSVSVTVKS
ncbi:RDH13 [Symbiodinium necroappetens]|uniref:RDH13 protein n=1 Tax=Symbiodinium necroappetens TaxID=1628268 RepID=A0A812YR58_9DINO|nr:RDH13 [Symbiodinium necroappetens]